MSTFSPDYVNCITTKGVLQITGEERVKYLQGQVTADIQKLTPNKMLLACHCDFKGKTWSVNYALDWQGSILLLPSQSALTQSMAELNKYGVFAKVDISEQTDNWQITGGAGEQFEQGIIKLFDSLPEDNHSVISNEHGLVIAFSSPVKRYLVLQPKSAEQQLECDLSDSANLWEVQDIQAGIADIHSSTANEFVPQMMNLHCIDAIDFEKGCYMGQEVIARTKYLGRNKKAGFILVSDVPNPNLVGEPLEFEIEGNWRPGGKILRSGTDQKQTWIFAVLANDTTVGSTFRLKSKPEVLFTTHALPYELS